MDCQRNFLVVVTVGRVRAGFTAETDTQAHVQTDTERYRDRQTKRYTDRHTDTEKTEKSEKLWRCFGDILAKKPRKSANNCTLSHKQQANHALTSCATSTVCKSDD